MDVDNRVPTPHGAENWQSPKRLGLTPLIQRRVEVPFVEATPQAIPPLPPRRSMPR